MTTDTGLSTPARWLLGIGGAAAGVALVAGSLATSNRSPDTPLLDQLGPEQRASLCQLYRDGGAAAVRAQWDGSRVALGGVLGDLERGC